MHEDSIPFLALAGAILLLVWLRRVDNQRDQINSAFAATSGPILGPPFLAAPGAVQNNSSTGGPILGPPYVPQKPGTISVDPTDGTVYS